MKTLADVIADTGPPDGVEFIAGGDVRCHCGRRAPPDMMVRFEGDWHCDGCISRHARERGLSRREMSRRLDPRMDVEKE